MIRAELKISYTFFYFWRKTKTFPLSLPEKWSEVPADLRLDSLRTLCKHEGEEARMRLLCLLTGLKRKVLFRLDDDKISLLTNHLAGITLQPSANPIISHFDHKGIRYYFPSDKFDNGRALEYPIADDFYKEYLETGDKIHLVNLVATLCRPRNTNEEEIKQTGDPRFKLYSDAHAKELGKTLVDLPFEICLAVKLYFEGVKLFVHQTYKTWLFPENSEGESSGGLSFGWWSIYFQASEAGLGSLPEVHQLLFKEVCAWEISRRDAAQRLEQQQNFQNAKTESHAQ